jgi:hypothetical protein
MVARLEDCEQMDHRLSTTLNNTSFQSLAYAIRVYLDTGKLGFYRTCGVWYQSRGDLA